MLNSTIVANINGGLSSVQKVSHGLHSSLLSPVDFTMTEIKTNTSAADDQKRFFTKSSVKGTSNLVFNGQGKGNSYLDQNRNPQSKQLRLVNGNKNSLDSGDDGMPVPKVHLYVGKIHSDWLQVHKIGAGLYNLGNTCFMNTVLQCLTYCPPLANYLLHDSDHASKCKLTGFCMMCELQQHMKRAISRPGDVIKPIQIYQKLQCIAKHFQFGRQEDAHEFLRYLIDNLWKSCLSNHEGYAKLDPASKETTVVNQIFGGYHRSQVTCIRCKEKSNTYDHFMDLMLDVKQNVLTLEKALEKFIQPELLQNENAYKCPQCKMKVSAQKKFTVYKAPNVATFQFKRFDYHRMCGGKITKHISYPENLNLRPYMSTTKGPPVMYRLNAVLVHLGASCNSGHYFCYVRNSNGFWYVMDDARVQQVSLNQVLNQNAYVLFYVRANPSETMNIKKNVEHAAGSMKSNHILKNGFVGPGNCISSSAVSRPSLNVKSAALPGISKLSVSTSSATTLQNGTAAKLYQKQSLQPVPQKRGKIAFTIGSSNANCAKENTVSKSGLSCTKSASPSSKSVLNGNTLVPYIEDSSSDSDDNGGGTKSKKEEQVTRSVQTFSHFKMGTKCSTTIKSAQLNKDKAVKTATQPFKLFSSNSSNANIQSEKAAGHCTPEKLTKKTEKDFDGNASFSKNHCEKSIAEDKEQSKSTSFSTHMLSNSCIVASQPVKVNATSSSWTVTEMNLQSPSIASGSSTNSVNSTTEWNAVDQETPGKKKDRNSIQVIRAIDPKNKTFIQGKLQKLKISGDGTEMHCEKEHMLKTPVILGSQAEALKTEKLEAKQSSDSCSPSMRLSKSPVTASAPDLCFPKRDVEIAENVNGGSYSKSPPDSHAKNETPKINRPDDNNKEPKLPFRNQSFQFLGTQAFLRSSRSNLQQTISQPEHKTKEPNSLKRPFSYVSEDTGSKWSSRFPNSNESSNGSLPKKLKTNHNISDKTERDYSIAQSHLKTDNTSDIKDKKEKCASLQSYSRTSLDANTSYAYRESNSSSKKNYSDSVFRHRDHRYEYPSSHKTKRTRKLERGYSSGSDSSSSIHSSKGSYEYAWVEKTKETIDKASNSKVPVKVRGLDSKSGQKESSRHYFPNSSTYHNDVGDVVSELQRNSSYMFGADVGSWNESKRSESPVFESKKKRYSDDYDDELDKGKVRRRKKHQYERNHYKYNPFQAYEEDKRKNKFYDDDWRSRKYYDRSYHYEDRYYKKKYYRSHYKYFPKVRHERHRHFRHH